MKVSKLETAIAASILSLTLSTVAFAQRDPGVRGGLQNTGGGLQQQGIPIPPPPLISPNPNHPDFKISDNEVALFEEGIRRMGQLESTCDTCSVAPFGVGDGNPVDDGTELDPFFPQFKTNSNGLGTRHNADSCLMCHAQPRLGGSGGFISPRKGQLAQNPQFDLIPHRFGRLNVVPGFEQQFGPIREVRFKFNPDGTRDGGVHALWTTRGDISDPLNRGCDAVQPDFATELSNGNLSFRIPLQEFGLGLIESIEDSEILAHHDATAVQRAALGITGHPNRSGNDGTITRFGWKAQNKSLAIFAGEAYNVEMGVSNDVFPNARDEDHNCASGKPAPNDINRIDPTDAENKGFNNPLHELPDWQTFLITMRFMDAPAPAPSPSQSAQRGRQVFSQVGCSLCHTPAMQTGGANGIGGPANSPVLVDRPVNLFSDLLVHHMGPALADDVIQGAAGPDEFRTTPLWGVGQRIFFLHDGRTSDLLQAILLHASGEGDGGTFPPSEANAVISRFRNLNKNDQQEILDFLRSL
ncbi:MAG TPA: di-heme oxidoredictase family protein [Candidatus Angelobacter sp.]|nr:di-heme oxidoredictase family protein [Candidatus Angelobacter sp.]